jgi:hypothetical protein
MPEATALINDKISSNSLLEKGRIPFIMVSDHILRMLWERFSTAINSVGQASAIVITMFEGQLDASKNHSHLTLRMKLHEKDTLSIISLIRFQKSLLFDRTDRSAARDQRLR